MGFVPIQVWGERAARIGLFHFRRPQSHERNRPIPKSVVEIDRDGAKSRERAGAAASDASKVRLRFGHLKGG
jgi:hypothetical protein